MPAVRQAQAPDYPYNVNARLAPHHYTALLMIAEARDIGLSAALRLVIDEIIEGKFDRGLKDLLEIVATVQPDPAWVARHGEDTE